MSQFSMLTRRYTCVMARDRRMTLTLAQPPLLGLVMLAALSAGDLTTPAFGDVPVASRAGLVLLVVMLGMTWLGASNRDHRQRLQPPLDGSLAVAARARVQPFAPGVFLVVGSLSVGHVYVRGTELAARAGAPIHVHPRDR